MQPGAQQEAAWEPVQLKEVLAYPLLLISSFLFLRCQLAKEVQVLLIIVRIAEDLIILC